MRRRDLVSAVIWSWVLFKLVPFVLIVGLSLLLVVLERKPN